MTDTIATTAAVEEGEVFPFGDSSEFYEWDTPPRNALCKMLGLQHLTVRVDIPSHGFVGVTFITDRRREYRYCGPLQSTHDVLSCMQLKIISIGLDNTVRLAFTPR